jgi:hypothetical protein
MEISPSTAREPWIGARRKGNAEIPPPAQINVRKEVFYFARNHLCKWGIDTTDIDHSR